MRYKPHPAADIFPMLGDAELKELANDIAANGLREPIWLYHDDEHGEVVLDGRNRLAACEIAGVEPETRLYTGDDPLEFIVSQNIMRRHLTPGQRAVAASRMLPFFEEQARRRQAEAGGDKKSQEYKKSLGAGLRQAIGATTATAEPQPAGAPEQQHKPAAKPAKRAPKAAAQAAKAFGASPRLVEQFKRVEHAAPDLAKKVETGEISLDRAERIVRDREAEQARIERAKAQAQAIETGCKIDLRLGDFRTVLADLRNVNAIITDPPYPHEFIPLLADLAKFADTVLAEDGVLAVLIGQTYLPEVFQLLSGGRPYRWTACYYTPGAGYTSHKAKLQSNWKPLLLYGGGPRLNDVVTSEGANADAKEHHKWGQDFRAFSTIVERLTEPGQIVVDPFAGGGTTLLAAHALGRHAIGAEIDPEAYRKAMERLS